MAVAVAGLEDQLTPLLSDRSGSDPVLLTLSAQVVLKGQKFNGFGTTRC
jgi:hypothetical protein